MLRTLDSLLAERRLVTDADISRAREIQRSYGGQLGDILIRIGAVSENDLLSTRHEQLGLPIFDRADAPVDLAILAGTMSAIAPIEWWLKLGAVAWRDPQTQELICVARDPLAVELQESFEAMLPDETPRYCLAYGKDLDLLLQSVKDYQRLGAGSSLDVSSGASLKEMGEDAPTIEFINKVLSQAVFSNASDIHIEPGERSFTVRLRIDGVLVEHTTQPLERYEGVVSRIKLLSGLDIAERRLPQDGRQTIRAAGKIYDLRVSSLPGAFGESIVMRLLGKQQEVLTLAGLGFRDGPREQLRSIAHRPNGIFLVTGPTGSGKSTTLHAVIREINDGERKIITVEDPVEYHAEGITQVQVKAEIELTFARALRSILRQDPDVIMIGEIRDAETAEIATQAALTGHMVFSTLHTNNAIGAVTRLINMGVEAFLLGAALEGMMAQRLVRRLCAKCAEPTGPPEALASHLDDVHRLIGGASQVAWKRPVGCKSCSGSGYRGRLGVFELIAVTSNLRAAISEAAGEERLAEIARQDGFISLYGDGIIKAALGQTTYDEIVRVVGETSS